AALPISPSGHHNPSAFCAQSQCRCQSNPRRAAGYQRHLSVEPKIHLLRLVVLSPSNVANPIKYTNSQSVLLSEKDAEARVRRHARFFFLGSDSFRSSLICPLAPACLANGYEAGEKTAIRDSYRDAPIC